MMKSKVNRHRPKIVVIGGRQFSPLLHTRKVFFPQPLKPNTSAVSGR